MNRQSKDLTKLAQGYVHLNSRKYWVVRYAEIYDEGIFQYTKKEKDTEVRGAYNLKDCTIKELYDNKQKSIIINTIQSKPITLKIRIKEESQHNNWLSALIKAKENANKNNLKQTTYNLESDDGQSAAPSELMTSQLQFSSISNNFQYEPKSVLPDNNNNPLIIDENLLSSLSDSELQNVKQQIKTFLIDYNQKDFSLSDCQSNLQLYSQKIVYQQDFNILKSFLIARKFIELMDKIQENLGTPGFSIILIMLFLALVYVLNLIHYSFNLIPYSFAIFLALNMILIPIFSQTIGKYVRQIRKVRQQRREKKYKLIGQAFYSHNINELLFSIQNHKERINIQPYLKEILTDINSNIIHLTYMDNTKESLRQVIFKEQNESVIYCAEIHINSNQIERLYKIDFSVYEQEGCHVKFYATAQFQSFNQVRGRNSPTILQGLDFSISTQKLNPESALGQYYYVAATKGVFAKYSIRDPQIMYKGLQVIHNQPTAVKQIPQQNGLTEQYQPVITEEQSLPESNQQIQEKKDNDEDLLDTEFESDFHRECYQKALKKYNEFEDLIRLDDRWKKIEVKGDLKVHSRVDPETDITISRGEHVINVSESILEEFLQDYSKKSSYDEMFKEGKTFNTFKSKTKFIVSYNRMKGKMGVADRDFIFAQAKFVKGNCQYTIATSVDHPDCPPVKGVVRGDLILGGWKIEILSENSVRVVYSTLAHPNGKIPEFIRNFAAKVQGYSVQKIKKILEKQHNA